VLGAIARRAEQDGRLHDVDVPALVERPALASVSVA